MAQWVEGLATNPDDLNLISGIHTMERGHQRFSLTSTCDLHL